MCPQVCEDEGLLLKHLLSAPLLPTFGATVAGPHVGFCAGFAQGYKRVKAEKTLVRVCPVAPATRRAQRRSGMASKLAFKPQIARSFWVASLRSG